MRKFFSIVGFLSLFTFSCSKVESSKNDPKPIGNDHKSVVSTSVNCPQHQIPNPPGFTPGTCPEAQLQAMNGSYFTLSEENAAYNFRDNLLFTRPIGRDYINYYYLLGEYANDNALLSNNPGFYVELLKKGFSVANILMNGADRDIVIDTNTYNYLQTALASFKVHLNAHPNANISTIITKLTEDLELNKGKTRVEILTFLNTCAACNP